MRPTEVQEEMPPTSSHRVPFGLRDGQMHRVESVATGKACGCICPECKSPLVAKNAGLKVRPYFAHLAGFGTVTCRETAIHMMAKRILVASRRLSLPEWKRHLVLRDISGEPHSFTELRAARQWHYATAREEHWHEGIRPDVFLSDGGAAASLPLLVEVKVSHAVDEHKAGLVHQRGWAMMEIDLSKIPEEELTPGRFEQYVLDDAPREWVYAPKAEQRFAKRSHALRAHVEALNEELRRQGVEERDSSGRTASERRRDKRIDELRKARRKPYLPDLKAIEQKTLPDALRRREEELRTAESEQIAAMIKRHGGKLPYFARTAHKAGWAINASSARWQLAAAEQFVFSAAEGTRVTSAVVAKWVESTFGVDEVAARLIQAQNEDRERRRRRGDVLVMREAWYLDAWENRLIPNVFNAVEHLLRKLVDAKHLLTSDRWTYQVDGPKGKEARRIAELQRKEQSHADFLRAQQAEEERQRLTQLSRAVFDRQRKERVEGLVQAYAALALTQSQCLDCQSCRWPSPPDAGDCINCGSRKLLLIRLDDDRLRELPHRLRSDPCVMRCKSYLFDTE